MALLKEIIPAELQEKPYLKDFLTLEQNPESFAKVFAKLDGAETLIGKRPNGIPGAEAKPEDWDKFLDGLKPEKEDAYVIPTKEGVKPDEAFIKELRASFHAGKISTVQAQKFLADYMPRLEKYANGKAEAQKAAQAKADAEFETLVKAAFGDESKADLARARKLISEHAPAVVKPYIDKLDNNSLAILTGVINGIAKKFMSEDDLNPKGAEGDGGKTLREQARAYAEVVAKMDPMDPKLDEAKAKLRAMYQAASEAK